MFNREDFIKYQGMKKVVSEGEYKIKGDAVLIMASLFSWFNDLESKIKLDIEPEKDMSKVKPVGVAKEIRKE